MTPGNVFTGLSLVRCVGSSHHQESDLANRPYEGQSVPDLMAKRKVRDSNPYACYDTLLSKQLDTPMSDLPKYPPWDSNPDSTDLESVASASWARRAYVPTVRFELTLVWS